MCPCNGAYLCTTCHGVMTREHFAARDTGFWVSRYEEDPSVHPIRSWTGDWILLDHEGGFTLADTEGVST